MQDTKNLIIAIILSMTVIAAWQHFFVTPQIQEAQRIAKIKEANEKKNITNQALNNINISPVPREEALEQTKRVKIYSDNLQGTISLKGARFDDLRLSKYKIYNSDDSPKVALLSPTNTSEAYFGEWGWVLNNQQSLSDKIIIPDSNTIWKADKDVLRVNEPIKLSWDNGEGLIFSMNISMDKNYMFTIDQKVENYTKNTISLLPYALLNRTKDLSSQTFFILHEGPIGVIDGLLKEVTYSDIKQSKKEHFDNVTGWVGITDKYWLSAIIPNNKNSFDANYNYSYYNNQNRFQVDYLGQSQNIAPDTSTTITTHFFAGPKEVNLLDEYAENLNITLFDRSVDFGWLYFITKPLFKLLTFFHSIVGNFGLAILLLTVLIKLILFPLANKSYVSMHQLKKFQPEIIKLKELHKDDKLKANQEIMKLYKKEKVNPMSGCLPILIQLPIFFALYKVLFITIEMRHAPFYGWITDLSMPDPTSIFNFFGLFPWSVPQFLIIGVWPIIMGLTMYLQQKLNPKPADPIQEKVMKFLPFLFTFLFASFPAGLVIYWAWNNSLSILQQWLITRKLSKKS